jgi:hypothetical protein
MLRALMSMSIAALALLIAPAASANVIDFTAQSSGNNANPLVLPGATFTTLGGFNYITNAFGSNGLCTSTSASNPADCSRDLEVLFDAPSSGISFTFAGNNDVTIGDDIGDVQFFAGATLLGTANVIVTDGSSFTSDLAAFAGFSGVTRLLISSTDIGGVVYDDFTFTQSSATVPEPASVGLVGLALAAVAFRKRLTR